MSKSINVDSNWLVYARDVLSDREHREMCLRAGGARPTQDFPYSELRWPGYVGKEYARILCLGMIHNGDMLFAGRSAGHKARNDEVDLDKSVLDLEPVAIDWLNGKASDEAYLTQTRITYGRALPHWDTWKRIRPIMKHFGFEGQEVVTGAIAYANIAKCWSDTADQKRRDTNVMACCNLWGMGSSLALIKAIRPVCILAATWNAGFSSGDLPILEDGQAPDLWQYHYLHGTVRTDGTKRLRDDWARDAAQSYASRMKMNSGIGPK